MNDLNLELESRTLHIIILIEEKTGGSIIVYVLVSGMLKSANLLVEFTFDVMFSVQWFLLRACMVTFVVLLVAWLAIQDINKIIIADVI